MAPDSNNMKNLQPKEAYDWLQTHAHALFVDIRMEIESLYVGRPPGVVNVPWYDYPDLQPIAAGKVLVDAGFTDVQHVVHGFEGELNEQFKRSTLSGWRFDGLPWEQM